MFYTFEQLVKEIDDVRGMVSNPSYICNKKDLRSEIAKALVESQNEIKDAGSAYNLMSRSFFPVEIRNQKTLDFYGSIRQKMNTNCSICENKAVQMLTKFDDKLGDEEMNHCMNNKLYVPEKMIVEFLCTKHSVTADDVCSDIGEKIEKL